MLLQFPWDHITGIRKSLDKIQNYMLSTLHHHQGLAAPNWPTHKILSLSHKNQALLAAADHELAESLCISWEEFSTWQLAPCTPGINSFLWNSTANHDHLEHASSCTSHHDRLQQQQHQQHQQHQLLLWVQQQKCRLLCSSLGFKNWGIFLQLFLKN